MSKGGALSLAPLGSPARARVVPPVAMALVPHIQGLVVRGLFLEHCFVTNEAPLRFPELLMPQMESPRQDELSWEEDDNGMRVWGCLRAQCYDPPPWQLPPRCFQVYKKRGVGVSKTKDIKSGLP